MEELRKTINDTDVLHLSAYGGKRWAILNDGDALAGAAEVTAEGHDNRKLRGDVSQNHRNLMGFQYLNDNGTTHLSIIDGDGNALTMTTTVS